MTAVELAREQLLIGGRWIDADGGGTFEQTFPYTGEAVGHAAAAGAGTPMPRLTPPTRPSANGDVARPASAARS